MLYIMKKIKQVKKYWNNQPCNINHSQKKFLSYDYFEEVRKKKYYVESHIPKFAEFKKYRNSNILEIGCGIGTDAIEFIKNGCKYHGIDLSERSVEITKARVKAYNLNKHKPVILVDNSENLKAIKKYIKKKKIKLKLIYSFGVLHHTPNMAEAFKSIHKIANKNTEIKIMLYAKNSYKNFLLSHSNYRYEAQKNCPVVYKVDDQDLNKLLKNRFKIISKTQDFIFPYKIAPYKKGIYKKIEFLEKMPKKIFKTLKKNIGEHLLLNLRKI